MISKKQIKSSADQNGEIRFRAKAVSRGIAIGKVVSLHGKKRQFYKVGLETSQIGKEIRRFQAALRLSKRQIGNLSSASNNQIQASILEAQLLILQDKSFISQVESIIREECVNAEWALEKVMDKYIAIYQDFTDEYLRERQADIKDITERILASLGGGGKSRFELEEDSIIVAKEVRPSTLLEFSQKNLKGVVVEMGGWTSHTFILAREQNLPAITGVKSVLRRLKSDDEVIVDGYNGQVIVNPSLETLENYRIAQAQFQQVCDIDFEPAKGRLITLDGKEIIIRANLENPKSYAQAKRFGAEGIGLYRSEYLFNRLRDFPSEEEQFQAYCKIADSVGGDGVKIRTFDVSSDQLASDSEKNPAIGLRAIRLMIKREKIFRGQIRALLRASYGRDIGIVLPMIADIGEILLTRNIIAEEGKKLAAKSIKIGAPKLGVMIEVPSAVLLIDELAAEADFFCLGTNDLIQHLLAADRDNEAVADWFRTLHPAVLKAIKRVIEASEKAKIPLLVCGEMAGSPLYAVILIGMGIRELSMNMNSIPRLRRVLSRIASEEAREIVGELASAKTANEVEGIITKRFSAKWTHLFPPEMLPDPKGKKI